MIGFGGQGVACWPLVPKFASSNPAEAVGFLGRKKSSARLPSEGKPSVPCRRFAACKRSLNLRGSRKPTVPLFAARISRVVAYGGTWRLKWERLKAGESNGKLPLSTCPGCIVPEPYRSHDWALVPAKPSLQDWILMNAYTYTCISHCYCLQISLDIVVFCTTFQILKEIDWLY